MSESRQTDIYYAVRKARFAGMSFVVAVSVVAEEFRTTERTVRIVAVKHGLYY